MEKDKTVQEIVGVETTARIIKLQEKILESKKEMFEIFSVLNRNHLIESNGKKNISRTDSLYYYLVGIEEMLIHLNDFAIECKNHSKLLEHPVQYKNTNSQ